MSCQQVPTAPAFNPYPRSVQVGEFEVAIGGGIWVAIGALIKLLNQSIYLFLCITIQFLIVVEFWNDITDI